MVHLQEKRNRKFSICKCVLCISLTKQLIYLLLHLVCSEYHFHVVRRDTCMIMSWSFNNRTIETHLLTYFAKQIVLITFSKLQGERERRENGWELWGLGLSLGNHFGSMLQRQATKMPKLFTRNWTQTLASNRCHRQSCRPTEVVYFADGQFT